MPWAGSGAFTYSTLSVTENAPHRSGAYVLYRGQGDNVYVGETGDIHARLLEHLGGDNECITRNKPTWFAFELVEASRRVARQDVLIVELRSVCNQKLG